MSIKHSHSESIESDKCKECNFRAGYEEALQIHMKELHTEKNPQRIEEEEMFDLNVKTDFPKFFITT